MTEPIRSALSHVDGKETARRRAQTGRARIALLAFIAIAGLSAYSGSWYIASYLSITAVPSTLLCWLVFRSRLAEHERLLKELEGDDVAGVSKPEVDSVPIVRPPGSRLRALAAAVYGPKTFSKVFEPTLDDFLWEYVQAVANGRKWQIRWVWLRGVWSFWSVVVARLPLLRTLYSVIKNVF